MTEVSCPICRAKGGLHKMDCQNAWYVAELERMNKPDMTIVKQNLNYLFVDLNMLLEGDWEPDLDSVTSSLDSLQRIADQLGVKLHDFRENRDG